MHFYEIVDGYWCLPAYFQFGLTFTAAMALRRVARIAMQPREELASCIRVRGVLLSASLALTLRK